MADGLKGHNVYNGIDFSPTRPMRSRLHAAPSMPHIASLRRELGIADRLSATKGRAHEAYEPPPPPPAAAPAASLTSSLSLPALPARRSRPPWALHGDDVEPMNAVPKRRGFPGDAADGAVLPTIAARRISTRERSWRESLAAADEGRGPDPLAIHILRKHGRRFKPGGLASQTRMEVGNSAFAIANVRLCTVNNGYPSVRMLPPAY